MSDEPFLIAHRVRNEPSFDIAIKQTCGICEGHGDGCDECDGEGYWWICSTSGHRAYPYWHDSLSSFARQDMDGSCNKLDFIPSMPDNCPDHYPSSASPKSSPSAGRSLLSLLGLGKASIRRRI